MTRKIDGQFVPHLSSTLNSPAWCVLSLSARRVLDRIEIELCDHGGKDNGRLPVTFADFEQYGVHRLAIAPSIREACALGLLEVTRRGLSGNGEFRRPNLFRLPYLPAYGKAPTHEWRKFETVEDAKKIASEARRTLKKPLPKKRFTTPGKRTGTGTENVPKTTPGKRTEAPQTPHPENVPLSREDLASLEAAGQGWRS